MKWSKKLIFAVLAVTVLLVGGMGGVALAQTGTVSSDSGKTLLGRVATILGIDQKKVEDAFAQARKEMRDEAQDNYFKDLVAQGKITQEQADQYKAWLKTRPDMEPYRQQLKTWQQTMPAMPSELKNWQEARPNIQFPGPSKPFGMHGFPGGRGGKMGGRCFGGMQGSTPTPSK